MLNWTNLPPLCFYGSLSQYLDLMSPSRSDFVPSSLTCAQLTWFPVPHSGLMSCCHLPICLTPCYILDPCPTPHTYCMHIPCPFLMYGWNYLKTLSGFAILTHQVQSLQYELVQSLSSTHQHYLDDRVVLYFFHISCNIKLKCFMFW